MSCKLCLNEKLTKRYYEDNLIWIANCLTCNIPMVVLKEHKMNLIEEEENKIINKIKEIFGNNITFRKNQRQILDHLHWHILINE